MADRRYRKGRFIGNPAPAPIPTIEVKDRAARREVLRRRRREQQLRLIESICKDLGTELPEFAVKMRAELEPEKVEAEAAA